MDPIHLPMVTSLYVIDHKPKADTTEEKKIEDRRDALRHREAMWTSADDKDRKYCGARKGHQPVFPHDDMVICVRDDIVTPMIPQKTPKEYLPEHFSARVANCDQYATYMAYLTNAHSIKKIADCLVKIRRCSLTPKKEEGPKGAG